MRYQIPDVLTSVLGATSITTMNAKFFLAFLQRWVKNFGPKFTRQYG